MFIVLTLTYQSNFQKVEKFFHFFQGKTYSAVFNVLQNKEFFHMTGFAFAYKYYSMSTYGVTLLKQHYTTKTHYVVRLH